MPQLVYSKSFNKNSFHLVELSNDDLVQAFESGSRLVIKGLPDDEAVLCTTSATYSVREVKTSNSLVLSTFDKDNHDTWRVVDDLSNTIEFLPCLARTNRINTLLHSTLYAGPSEEFKHQNKTMYTFSDLLSTVQASEQELIQGLKERNAFEIQGYYRLFERNYLHRLLDALVTQAIIQGHDVKEMSVKNAYECVREGLAAVEDEPTSVPDAVIMACIAAFADDDTDLTVATNSVHFNEKKICRFLGEVILASAKGKEWRLEDFMEVWRQVTPDVYQPQMEALQGLCIAFDRTAVQRVQTYVTYFPLDELSTDPAQRFAALFAEKRHWSPEEITPYVRDLAPDPKKRDALLLKFTRIQKTGGKVLYGSRVK